MSKFWPSTIRCARAISRATIGSASISMVGWRASGCRRRTSGGSCPGRCRRTAAAGCRRGRRASAPPAARPRGPAGCCGPRRSCRRCSACPGCRWNGSPARAARRRAAGRPARDGRRLARDRADFQADRRRAGEVRDQLADPGQVALAHLVHDEGVGRVQHQAVVAGAACRGLSQVWTSSAGNSASRRSRQRGQASIGKAVRTGWPRARAVRWKVAGMGQTTTGTWHAHPAARSQRAAMPQLRRLHGPPAHAVDRAVLAARLRGSFRP